MIRDLSEDTVNFLINKIRSSNLPLEDKESMIFSLSIEPKNIEYSPKKRERQLVNTSCTLYHDQIEHAQDVEDNVSLYVRKAIDFYWKNGEKT